MTIGPGLVGALCVAALVPLAVAHSAEVQIAGLSDLNLGRWNGTADLMGTVTHCVRSTAPGARFAIAISGDGPAGGFLLSGGAGAIPYRVAYNDGRGWIDAAPGTPIASQRGYANAIQFNRCLSGASQRQSLRVQVLGSDLGAALSGSYSGTVSLLITPE